MTNPARLVDVAIGSAVGASTTMPKDSMPKNLRRQFRASLHQSLTTGRVAMATTGLGPQTISAMVAVAEAHPEAPAQLIIAAYDAFASEHARVGTDERNISAETAKQRRAARTEPLGQRGPLNADGQPLTPTRTPTWWVRHRSAAR